MYNFKDSLVDDRMFKTIQTAAKTESKNNKVALEPIMF